MLGLHQLLRACDGEGEEELVLLSVVRALASFARLERVLVVANGLVVGQETDRALAGTA